MSHEGIPSYGRLTTKSVDVIIRPLYCEALVQQSWIEISSVQGFGCWKPKHVQAVARNLSAWPFCYCMFNLLHGHNDSTLLLRESISVFIRTCSAARGMPTAVNPNHNGELVPFLRTLGSPNINRQTI